MRGISAVERFRSKTLLPGSLPEISAARARASWEALRLFRIRSKTFFRDPSPGFPRRARARPSKLFVELLEAKRYFRDLCPGFPPCALARPLEAKSKLTSGIYARDFRGARARPSEARRRKAVQQTATSGIYARDFRGARARVRRSSS